MTSHEIHYILVSRGTTVLADYFYNNGTFIEFTQTILKEINSGKSVLLYKE